MSDRLIRLVAKAIGDVDGVNSPTYEHLAKAAVAVIEQEFEGFRRENDRLRDLMSLQNTEIEKLRAALMYRANPEPWGDDGGCGQLPE